MTCIYLDAKMKDNIKYRETKDILSKLEPVRLSEAGIVFCLATILMVINTASNAVQEFKGLSHVDIKRSVNIPIGQ